MTSDLIYRTWESEEPGSLTVVALHGRAGNEESLLSLGPRLALPLRLITPRGPLPVKTKRHSGYAWYGIAQVGVPVTADFERSLDQLTQWIHSLRAQYSIPQERLIVLGFSQGAVMATALALHAPQAIGGIVAMSGYFARPQGWSPPNTHLAGLPALVTHGSADDVLPPEWGRKAADELRHRGAAVTYREVPEQHEVGPAAVTAVASWLHERGKDRPQGG